VRPALPGLPVEQRQTAEAGVTAAAGGCYGRNVLDGHSDAVAPLRPPIGTALAVCASAWLMFKWCWVRQLVMRLSRPDRGAAAAGRRDPGGLGGVRGATRRLRLVG